MSLPKVMHLTSVHPPFDSRIFYKECQTLAEHGYSVVLGVAVDPQQCQDGQLKNGVRMRTVPKPSGRRERMQQTTAALLQVALSEDAALYHFHDPELLFTGLHLKRVGKRVVYDVHEDLPRQILTKPWVPRPLRPILASLAERVERYGANRFDAIVVAEPSVAPRFPREKRTIVQNFPIASELWTPDALPLRQRPPHVAYVGGVMEQRGAFEMLRAMAALPETLQARLEIAGSIMPPALQQQLEREPGWKHVDFLGWQSREGVRELLARVRAGLVTLHPVPNYVEAYPVKMFEYMAAGLPVIASDFPLWRRIIEEAHCGLLVDPMDPQAIAEAMTYLLTHEEEAEAMGRRGRQAVLERYSWESQAEHLLALYDRLLA